MKVKKYPFKKYDKPPRLVIEVTGPGWRYVGRPLKVPDATIHLELSNEDGSTVVRKGKKRTHKAFPPLP